MSPARTTGAGPAVVLLGPPGAGVGGAARAVAERLGAPLVETDDLVAQAAGKPVGDVFVEDGEAAFRALERVALTDALSRPGAVVAAGGGVVDDEASRASLRAFRDGGGTVVLLEVSLAQAVPRLGLNQPRPVALGNPRQRWNELLAARLPHYLDVATHRVVTDEKDESAVADEVVALLGDVSGVGADRTGPEER